MEQLEKGGSVSRGWLGVKIQDIDRDLAGSLGLKEPKGAVISEVLADGPAAEAGLKVEDTILEVNSKKIEDPRDLQRTIADLPAKASVEIKVWRNKGEQTMRVKLGTYPNKEEVAADASEPDDADKDRGNVDLKQLGLTLKPASPGDKEGVVIAEVDPNSDAAQKGLKEGDVILKAGDATVSSPQDVIAALKKTKDDGLPAVMLHVKKNGEQTVLVAIPLNKS